MVSFSLSKVLKPVLLTIIKNALKKSTHSRLKVSTVKKQKNVASSGFCKIQNQLYANVIDQITQVAT